MSVDPLLERVVRNELARRDRLVAAPVSRENGARALAHRLHAGQHDLLAHLRRVAEGVPNPLRAIAWLHHAGTGRLGRRELAVVGLTAAEARAIELLAELESPPGADRLRVLEKASDFAGRLALGVARVAVADVRR